jgi:acetylornithine deacetylase/succinyl-diaminopimelate desuccinylase-like protein
MRMLSEAGFGQVTRIPSDGQPGIFATLDAGAPRTLGLYFMYDVKQVDPAEWSSPPWEAALVDKPGLGKVLMGRGAVNQKGPEASFLAALHAIRGAGRKPPVNLVLIAPVFESWMQRVALSVPIENLEPSGLKPAWKL